MKRRKPIHVHHCFDCWALPGDGVECALDYSSREEEPRGFIHLPPLPSAEYCYLEASAPQNLFSSTLQQ